MNLGLLHYKGAFDVIHVSSVAQGISDYRKMLDEIAEILRPGGVFLAADGDMFLWNESQQVVPLRAEGQPVSSSYPSSLQVLRRSRACDVSRASVGHLAFSMRCVTQ